MNVHIEKVKARRQGMALRDAIQGRNKAECDAALCRAILESAAFRYATVLLTYSPIGSEIDVSPVAQAAAARGMRVAFPRTQGGGNMTFHMAQPETLTKGRYGILEPSPDMPLYQGDSRALCLVPGLLFDEQGYRVGYGGGYYDRFLSSFKGTAVGVAYTALLVPQVPRGKFDRRCGTIFTEKGLVVTQ